MTSEKTCSQCHATKPRSEFYVRRASPDGLEARCKTCAKRIENGRADIRRRSSASRPTPTTKICAICKIEKDRNNFSIQKASTDLLHSYCHECRRARFKTEYSANPDKFKAAQKSRGLKWRLGKLGITINDYSELLMAQGGHCAICPARKGSMDGTQDLVTDHDHVTGLLRGLLCHKCNMAIGLLSDDPLRAFNCVLYLMRFAAKHNAGNSIEAAGGVKSQ